MISWLNHFIIESTGMTGAKAHLIGAMMGSVLILLITPLIGFVAQKIETLEYRMIGKRYGDRFAKTFCSYLTFPGTMLHEICHAVAAIFTGAKITKMALFKPQKDGTLGYVRFQTRGRLSKQRIQMAATSSAPVIGGMLIVSVIHRILSLPVPFYSRLCFWYLIICIVNHMTMSRADLKIYLKGCFYLLFPMTAILFIYLYLAS